MLRTLKYWPASGRGARVSACAGLINQLQSCRDKPDQFLTLYRLYTNLLTKLTRTTREQYYRNLLESSFGNIRKVWSNINSILGKKHRSQNTSIRLNVIVVSKSEPSTFNFYFNDIRMEQRNSIRKLSSMIKFQSHNFFPNISS